MRSVASQSRPVLCSWRMAGCIGWLIDAIVWLILTPRGWYLLLCLGLALLSPFALLALPLLWLVPPRLMT